MCENIIKVRVHSMVKSQNEEYPIDVISIVDKMLGYQMIVKPFS